MLPVVLLVDDDPAIQLAYSTFLTRSGYSVTTAGSISKADEALDGSNVDAILLDLILPDGSGLDWIEKARLRYPDVPLIIITGRNDISMAVEAIQKGANNYLTKPVNMKALDLFLKKCLELGTLRKRSNVCRRLAKNDEPYFGTSPAIQRMTKLASIAAEEEIIVLLQGETGTGKGVMARWIHEHSDRKTSPFVDVNCSNLRGELLASELFGHVRGAFTSAYQDRSGLIEIASGGTLFLDEIGDMDPSVQAQFLKVIEEKQYRRMGDTRTRHSNFRLICATNKNLQGEVRKGNFRLDLFFRLNVFPVVVPTLQERQEDIKGLIDRVLIGSGLSCAGISDQAVRLLKSYPWPGNVRELRNVLERAVVLARRKTLLPEHFPGLTPAGGSQSTFNLNDLAEVKISQAIRDCEGDIKRAAEELGISRATLYRKLKRLQEEKSHAPEPDLPHNGKENIGVDFHLN
ncbi:MAG: sigma-54 dependent transcriptional regulator [Syntrophorhabdales bacterium]|jgi:DNA-binding NtrC family response regulator